VPSPFFGALLNICTKEAFVYFINYPIFFNYSRINVIKMQKRCIDKAIASALTFYHPLATIRETDKLAKKGVSSHV